MADETTKPFTPPAPAPFVPFADPKPVVEVEKDPDTAAARLRAFEDDAFGEDAVRIGDQVERGSGSPFAAMSVEQKAHYAALEKLVAAERRVDAANAALMTAQVDYDAAVEAVDASIKAVDDAKVKADEQAKAAQDRADARAARQPAKV